MISILEYFEFSRGTGRGMGVGMSGKINAPMFVWKILYNKPPPFMPGRGLPHEQVNWKGIGIDKAIPLNTLNTLNNIDAIELRASCQGGDKDHPTFIIFRTKNQDEAYVKKFISKLNKHTNIKAGYDKGMGGQYRIGVTTNLWYDKDPSKFKSWWMALPKIIKNSL